MDEMPDDSTPRNINGDASRSPAANHSNLDRRQFGRLVVSASAIAVQAVVCTTVASSGPTVSRYPPAFRNPALPIRVRVKDLMARLTLDEKASLLSDATPAIPRLNIPAYHYGNEALHGIVRPGTATVFPQAIGLAATWNPGLVKKMAIAISDEARAKYDHYSERHGFSYSGLLTFWSPVVNLARDPRWGRTQETYGEDPYLTGVLGEAYVQGLQGDSLKFLKALACPKHLVVYSREFQRFSTNAVVSEKQLREYYLKPFRACVIGGHAESLMSAYTAINGIPCSANRWLLTDVLRREWGFKGFVVSDCGAISNLFSQYHYVKNKDDAAAAALNAGVNLECGHMFRTHLLQAVRKGLVKESTLNRAVSDVLRTRFCLGMFEPQDQFHHSRNQASVIGAPSHVALARQLARQSIVLLKNAKVNGHPLLPLDRTKVSTIAVVGPNAAICQFGDYSGNPANPAVTPFAGIRSRAGDKIVAKLVPWSLDLSPIPSIYLASGRTHAGLIGEYFDNSKLTGKPAAERCDPEVDFKDWGYTTPIDALSKLQYSVRWTGHLLAPFSGGYTLGVRVDGAARLYFEGNQLFEGSNGEFSRLLSLEAGRSYVLRLDYIHYKNTDRGIRLVWKPPVQGLETVRESDIIIAVLGLNTDTETEGKDRKTISLPTTQREFIRQIVRANPRTIVVLENGSAVAIKWIQEHVPGILEAWYPGEQGGNAIADVLFGDYNPGGRLPLTFYSSDAQLRPFDEYDITKGRTYMYLDQLPLYPFGYGLSYTRFRYENLQLSAKHARVNSTLQLSVDVENIGPHDGDEVVQVYVHQEKARFSQPIKQLKAFRRIHLKKGKRQTLMLTLAVKDWAHWDEQRNSFVVDPGLYDVLVGASSADIRLKRKVRVLGATPN